MTAIKGLALLALLMASIGGLGLGLISRSAPAGASASTPVQETVTKQGLQGALRDASLLDLIRNARVAARKGDAVTYGAMVSGLRRESSRARTLIHSEISQSKDTTDISILNRMITELP